jgi:putative SOS response-associated peptidase YedK
MSQSGCDKSQAEFASEGPVMCGRFTQKYTWRELADLYRLNQTSQNIRPAYNICPTDPVGVLIPGALRVVPTACF